MEEEAEGDADIPVARRICQVIDIAAYRGKRQVVDKVKLGYHLGIAEPTAIDRAARRGFHLDAAEGSWEANLCPLQE